MVVNVGHTGQLLNLDALQQVLARENTVVVAILVQLLDINVDAILCYRIVVVTLRVVLKQRLDAAVMLYMHVTVIMYYL